MFQEGRAGLAKHPRQFGPGIGCTHIDDPHRCDPRPWGFDPIEARGLATLHTAPELLFRGQQQMLVEAIAGIEISTHLPPPVMMESTAALALVCLLYTSPSPRDR